MIIINLNFSITAGISSDWVQIGSVNKIPALTTRGICPDDGAFNSNSYSGLRYYVDTTGKIKIFGGIANRTYYLSIMYPSSSQ